MTDKEQFPNCPNKMKVPCFVMCPPNFVDTTIENNIWMKEAKDIAIDRERFFAQWCNLYEALAGLALVYLMPPRKNLQDQTYVNSFACLNLFDRNVAIISNFTAEGREDESEIAENFLRSLYFETYRCEYKFEGFPELKYIKNIKGQNIFCGGYGIRTEEKALDWIADTFGVKIIKINETNEYLYHLDGSFFVLDNENVILATKGVDQKCIKEIEKVCNIHDVDEDEAESGICNSLRANNLILNSSNLPYMSKTDEYFDVERKKNDHLEKICMNVGLEIFFLNLDEAQKSGAMLSCFVAPLNYIDLSVPETIVQKGNK